MRITTLKETIMSKKSKELRERTIKPAAVIAAVWLAALFSAGLYSEHAPLPTGAAAAVFQLSSVTADAVRTQ